MGHERHRIHATANVVPSALDHRSVPVPVPAALRERRSALKLRQEETSNGPMIWRNARVASRIPRQTRAHLDNRPARRRDHCCDRGRRSDRRRTRPRAPAAPADRRRDDEISSEAFSCRLDASPVGTCKRDAGPTLHRSGPVKRDAGPTLHPSGPVKRDVGPTLHRSGLVKRDVGPTLHRPGFVKRDAGPTLHRSGPVKRDARPDASPVGTCEA